MRAVAACSAARAARVGLAPLLHAHQAGDDLEAVLDAVIALAEREFVPGGEFLRLGAKPAQAGVLRQQRFDRDRPARRRRVHFQATSVSQPFSRCRGNKGLISARESVRQPTHY